MNPSREEILAARQRELDAMPGDRELRGQVWDFLFWNLMSTKQKVQRIIERAAAEGMKLIRGCDVSQNEQTHAANVGRSESVSKQAGFIVHEHEAEGK